MAYHFNGISDKVSFSAAPFNGYVIGAITYALFLKRTPGSNHDLLGFWQSNNTLQSEVFWNNADLVRVLQGVAQDFTTFSSSTVWYILVASFNSSNQGRLHWWNGTSWANFNAGGAVNPKTIGATDQIRVSDGATAGFLSGDVVCAGIKKSDTTDLQATSLSPTDFNTWKSFGFDWLVGFDTSQQSGGILPNLSAPGSGDQISISGTSVVADPPGWVWPASGGSGGGTGVRAVDRRRKAVASKSTTSLAQGTSSSGIQEPNAITGSPGGALGTGDNADRYAPGIEQV